MRRSDRTPSTGFFLFTTEQKYFLGGTKTYAPCTIGAEFRWEIGLWARIRTPLALHVDRVACGPPALQDAPAAP